jgi:RimJ/RimL family protein N-acetyltransferase
VIALVPITPERAREIVSGDFGGLERAAGWPHTDTIDGLRLVESGADAWLVELDGIVIGDCGTTGPSGKEVEIGFGLAAEYRGLGHGTAIVRVLAATLLERGGVQRIVAHTLLGNATSRRVLEKGGFVLENERDGLARYASYAPI